MRRILGALCLMSGLASHSISSSAASSPARDRSYDALEDGRLQLQSQDASHLNMRAAAGVRETSFCAGKAGCPCRR